MCANKYYYHTDHDGSKRMGYMQDATIDFSGTEAGKAAHDRYHPPIMLFFSYSCCRDGASIAGKRSKVSVPVTIS